MKAMRLNGWGQPVQLEEIQQPTPSADEVLVRVHAASINPFDSIVQMGYLQQFFSTPMTMGSDFSGEVAAVGSEVTNFKPGDEVYGMVAMQAGTFAEYLTAKASLLARKPSTVSHVEAAGVPLACLAAYQSLFDLGQAREGERVLIIGAGGSVGATALQLAKDAGLHVTAVDIPEKAGFVKGLGPDRFIDGKNERFEDVAGTVDLVLDFVGGEYQQRSYNVLQPGGRYVTSLMIESQEEAERRGIRAVGLGAQPRADQLEDLARRIDAGRLKTFVNCTFPLTEAQTALEFRQKTTNPGKIVLTVV